MVNDYTYGQVLLSMVNMKLRGARAAYANANGLVYMETSSTWDKYQGTPKDYYRYCY